MAEFNFLCILDDIIDIVTSVIELNQFSLIADKVYESPSPTEIKEFNQETIRDALFFRGIYFYSGDYSIHSPCWHKSMVSDHYTIYSLESGPALQLQFFQERQTFDSIVLGKGSLLYESFYTKPGTLECFPAPRSLKDDYKKIKKMLIGKMKKRYLLKEIEGSGGLPINLGKYPVWIGKKGYRLLEENENASIEFPVRFYWKFSDLTDLRAK